ncbi:putative 2-dehydropantoate 2-reductase [Smittium mucronatum]|uniref:2-dehydropantoate 2-reductase n=1 Tax=Smittium mucronatum TaxID=133383 RepID=A0A1R0GZA5_9FUNG|nr:putative 2-dehydropantoate 2-reductase [Smittium mucronatum]
MTIADSNVQILVVGGGALGSMFGWRLQVSGCSVSFVCRSNYEVVSQSGFRIESTRFGNNQFIPNSLYRNCKDAFDKQTFDYVLICTKSLPNLSNPADMLLGCEIDSRTVFVLMQNGINIERYFYSEFPQNRFISAIAYIDTKQVESGVIVHGEAGSLTFGIYTPNEIKDDGSFPSPICQTLETHLIAGGFSAKISENIQRDRWLKLVWNSTLNPISVLAGGLNSKEIFKDPELVNFITEVMMETISIGEAVVGGPLSSIPREDIPKSLLDPIRIRKNPVYPSMLVDFTFKRPMEHQVILKNALDYAADFNVNAPMLKTIYHLIVSNERKYL